LIDLIVEHRKQRKFIELPATEEKLRQMRERLSAAPESVVDIDYVHCRYLSVRFNEILHKNHILYGICTPEEILELNLLAYVLKRMDEVQLEEFDRNAQSGHTKKLINLALFYALPENKRHQYRSSGYALYNGGNLETLLEKERGYRE